MNLKAQFGTLLMCAGLSLVPCSYAQTPSSAPVARPTPSAPAASGGAVTGREAAPGLNEKAPAPMKKEETKSKYKLPETAAPGGGAGKVWVNTASKTYHCPGTKYFGKTKAGEYMSEADAKAAGNHADHKKACS
jgi:hypothetical protein